MLKIIELQKGKHYEIRIEAGFDPQSGKRKRLKRRFRGRKPDAEVYAAELEKTVKSGTYLHEKIRLSDYMDTWIESHGPSLAPSTLATYKAIINNHIKPAIGRCRVSDLTSAMIQGYYSDKLKVLQPRSVEQHHSVLGKALRQAVKLALISYNPIGDVLAPKPKGRVAKTLTIDQVVALLGQFKGHKYEAVYITAAFTGMRLGEVLALRWEDVALPTVYVRQSLSRIDGQNHFRRPKGGKTRGLVVPHIVMKAINSQQTAGELVFSEPDGAPHNPSSVSKTFIRMALKHGYAIRLHDLRHSFATQLALMGEHPQTVQQALGHHDPGFTLSQYTHAFNSLQEQVADKYNHYLNGTKMAQNSDGVTSSSEDENPETLLN